MQHLRADLVTHLIVSLKSGFIFGLAGIFGKSAQIIIAILLIRNMAISDYGLLEFLLVLSNLLVVLFTFGQDSATARYFFENNDPQYRQQLISQSLLFQLIALCIGLPVVWLIARLIVNLSAQTEVYELLIPFLLVQVPFLLIIDFALNILSWSRSPRAYSVLMIGSSISQLISLLILINTSIPNIKTALFAYLVSYAASAFLGIFLIRHWLVWPKNFEKVKLTLSYAAPIAIISIAAAVMPALERALIDNYLSKQSLGEYAIASKILLIPLFFYTIFNIIWTPLYLAIHKNSNAQDLYNLILKILCVVGGLAFLIINSIADFLIEILAGRVYPGVSPILFFLSFALLIRNLAGTLEIGFYLSGRTYLHLVTYGCEIFIIISLSILIAPNFGLSGMGAVILLGRCVNLALVALIGQSVYPLRWEASFMVLVTGVAFLTNALALVAKHYEHFFLTICMELICAFCILHLFMRFLSNSDRNFLAEVYRFLRKRN